MSPQRRGVSGTETRIQGIVRDVTEIKQTKIAFTQAGEPRELPPDVQTVLLRVCQESLTNIRRHSEASEAAVILRYDTREVILVVRDNGIGFDIPAVQIEKSGASFGLIGMQQRAEQIKGKISIESAETQGTTVRLSIPIS